MAKDLIKSSTSENFSSYTVDQLIAVNCVWHVLGVTGLLSPSTYIYVASSKQHLGRYDIATSFSMQNLQDYFKGASVWS